MSQLYNFYFLLHAIFVEIINNTLWQRLKLKDQANTPTK